jgi:hypothetical protein
MSTVACGAGVGSSASTSALAAPPRRVQLVIGRVGHRRARPVGHRLGRNRHPLDRLRHAHRGHPGAAGRRPGRHARGGRLVHRADHQRDVGNQTFTVRVLAGHPDLAAPGRSVTGPSIRRPSRLGRVWDGIGAAGSPIQEAGSAPRAAGGCAGHLDASRDPGRLHPAGGDDRVAPQVVAEPAPADDPATTGPEAIPMRSRTGPPPGRLWWAVTHKQAHYLLSSGPTSPPCSKRCAGLLWHRIPELDRTQDRGHGRVECAPSRPSPSATSASPRRAGPPRSPAGPAWLADYLRGHWAIEAVHHLRDVSFAEDGSQLRSGTGPSVMACPGQPLAIGVRSRAGPVNLAAALRHHARDPARPWPPSTSPREQPHANRRHQKTPEPWHP